MKANVRWALLLASVSQVSGWAASAADGDIPFAHVQIDGSSANSMHVKTVGDFDGDGFVDLLVASTGSEIYWYEYPTWDRHLISLWVAGWSTDAESGDIDGDQDVDLVISDWSGRLVWLENPAPTGAPREDPWVLHVIGSPDAHDIELSDLDGDGDLDAVTRQQGTAGASVRVWRQNSPDSWTLRTIVSIEGEGLHLGDLDVDGDDDIILGDRWYENDGDISGGAWIERTFAPTWNYGATMPWMADINDDGRPDVVVTPTEGAGGSYRTSWFEAPLDVINGTWTEHVIDGTIETVTHSLGVGDMDGDGDIDVVTAEMTQGEDPDEIRVYRNANNGLDWEKQIVDTTGSHGLRVVDIGGDGDLDLFGANWSGTQVVDLWENLSPPAASVPAVSDWGAGVLALLVATSGWTMRRRRNQQLVA